VVAFFICWAPFHTQRLISIYSSPDDVQQRAAASKALQAVLFYSSGILYYVSSVINPILYNIMSLKFRRAFKTTLCRGGCCAWCCRDGVDSRVQATGGRGGDRPRRPMAYRFNGDGHVQMLRIDSHERVGVGVHLRCPPGRGAASPASAPAKFSDGSVSSGHGRSTVARVAGHRSTGVSEQFLLNGTSAQCRLFSVMPLKAEKVGYSAQMYQTKQMSSIQKENLLYSCRDEYLSKRKNVTRIDCIKQLFKNSNRKVFLSKTVGQLLFAPWAWAYSTLHR